MQTDAQRRAVSNYRKKSVRQIVMRFYPNEQDDAICNWIKSHENVNQYLKSLVLDDMKKGYVKLLVGFAKSVIGDTTYQIC